RAPAVALPHLTNAELAIIRRAGSRRVFGADGRELEAWSREDIEQTLDLLGQHLIACGFHGEWQPTDYGVEIESVIGKLDDVLEAAEVDGHSALPAQAPSVGR
ncbi:MAG: hypothetical protein R3D57_20925, partial [Hyphomicrobiaceae bacterium]